MARYENLALAPAAVRCGIPMVGWAGQGAPPPPGVPPIPIAICTVTNTIQETANARIQNPGLVSQRFICPFSSVRCG